MITNLELNNMSKSELVTLLRRIWAILFRDESTRAPEYRLSEEELIKDLLLK